MITPLEDVIMARQTNIQIRRGTAAGWAGANPTLNAGEMALETDTRKIKVGDGSTAWNSLQYVRLDGGSLDDGAPTTTTTPDNSCPAPSMRILMEDGSLLAAGELKKGMRVRTRHETTMEEGSYEVTHVSVVEAERLGIRIGEVDFVCSRSHKFYIENSWRTAESLGIGDFEVSSIEELGLGEVVKITVDSAHTYICEGLLSHNKGTTAAPTTTTAAPTTTTAAPTTTTAAPTTTTLAPVAGYLFSGNATTLGFASTGTYCDTGIRNSNGVPIYRKQLSPSWYAYLIRGLGASSQTWFIVVSTSATQFPQNAVYQGDSSAAWYNVSGSGGATPPSSGWNISPGPPTSGSITSVTATTCT